MTYCQIYYSGEWIYLKRKGKMWYGKINFIHRDIKKYIEISKSGKIYFSHKDEYISREEYENGLLKSL